MAWSHFIEGPGGGRMRCHGKCWPYAVRLAKAHQRDVVVRYQGPKVEGNRDPAKSDYVAHPDGSIDQSIDPTWWLAKK